MGVFLVLVGLVGILVGLVNVVYPISQLKITSRKRAAAVLGASFAVLVAGAILVPPSETASNPDKSRAAEVTVADTPPETQAEPQPAVQAEPQPNAAVAAQPTAVSEAQTESRETTMAGADAAPVAVAVQTRQGTPAATASAPSTTSPVAAVPHAETVPVVGVTDGDTIKVSVGGTVKSVRLIGVDTPETVHPSKPVEPYGPEASAYTKRRLSGQNVRLEFDVEERDHYGRLLAYVWLGDELFNASLVKDGYAQVLTIPPNVKYADLFVALQREARENNRGLWGLEVAAQQPAPAPAPAPTPAPSGSSVSYKNCTAVREAGAAPIYRGQPGYGTHLDRDGDGVACEK